MSRPASGTKSLVKDAWRRASTSKMLFADKMSEVGFSRPHGRQATEALTRVWLSVGVSKAATRSWASDHSTSTRPSILSDWASSPPRTRSGGMRGTGPRALMGALQEAGETSLRKVKRTEGGMLGKECVWRGCLGGVT